MKIVDYAKPRGVRGFTADILTENEKMIRLTRQCTTDVCITPSYGTYEVTMVFDKESLRNCRKPNKIISRIHRRLCS
jgi:hypothetical protein